MVLLDPETQATTPIPIPLPLPQSQEVKVLSLGGTHKNWDTRCVKGCLLGDTGVVGPGRGRRLLSEKKKKTWYPLDLARQRKRAKMVPANQSIKVAGTCCKKTKEKIV